MHAANRKVDFTHLKLWIAVARHNFKWMDFFYVALKESKDGICHLITWEIRLFNTKVTRV